MSDHSFQKNHLVTGGLTKEQSDYARYIRKQLTDLMKDVSHLVHIEETMNLRELCDAMPDLDEELKEFMLYIAGSKEKEALIHRTAV